MQFAKDAVRQRIIEIARQEFLEKGFERASVRTITAKAETAKSNLYNYFADKDGLFRAVLEPTMTEIEHGLELAKRFNVPKDAQDYTFQSQQLVIRAIAQFAATHVSDLRLLLFKAQGSSLEGFKHQVLDRFTEILLAWTRSIRTDNGVSELFVRTVCGFYLNVMEQLFLTGPPSDMDKFLSEITTFVYHGWSKVLGG